MASSLNHLKMITLTFVMHTFLHIYFPYARHAQMAQIPLQNVGRCQLLRCIN